MLSAGSGIYAGMMPVDAGSHFRNAHANSFYTPLKYDGKQPSVELFDHTISFTARPGRTHR